MDLRPTRLECTMDLAKGYIHEYFDQNPLSMLLLLGIRDGLAERWSTWSGNPTELVNQLDKVRKEPLGEPSIQNALELSKQTLQHVPSHVSREVILVYGSLSTCDPTSLADTISSLVANQIRVSIIGLSASLKICETIARETKGTYKVILNDAHFKELLHGHVPPPPLLQTTNQMIQMGFPRHSLPSMCAWYE